MSLEAQTTNGQIQYVTFNVCVQIEFAARYIKITQVSVENLSPFMPEESVNLLIPIVIRYGRYSVRYKANLDDNEPHHGITSLQRGLPRIIR